MIVPPGVKPPKNWIKTTNSPIIYKFIGDYCIDNTNPMRPVSTTWFDIQQKIKAYCFRIGLDPDLLEYW
jgi:hypothetical protein